MSIQKLFGLPVVPIDSIGQIVPTEGVLIGHTNGEAFLVGGALLAKVMKMVTTPKQLITRAVNLVNQSRSATSEVMDYSLNNKLLLIAGDLADSIENYRILAVKVGCASYVGYKPKTGDLEVNWSLTVSYDKSPSQLLNALVELEADGPNGAIRNKQRSILNKRISKINNLPLYRDCKYLKMWDVMFCKTIMNEDGIVSANRIPAAISYTVGGFATLSAKNVATTAKPSSEFNTLGSLLSFELSEQSEVTQRSEEIFDKSGGSVVPTVDTVTGGGVVSDTDKASYAIQTAVLQSTTASYNLGSKSGLVGRLNSPAVWVCYAQFLMEGKGNTSKYTMSIFGEDMMSVLQREREAYDYANWESSGADLSGVV